MTLSDRSARVVLTAAWVLAIALVNPSGDFPINDDWSYAETVRRLVEHGEWRLNPWTSMPLATQVLWGWLFSQPAGYSFTALRASTLVLAWAATLGTFAFLRLSGAAAGVALCGAATLAVCPVFFPLAFTFMTDVPALAFGVWALVCVLKYVEERRPACLAGTFALLVCTTLTRQTGIAFSLAAMAALLVSPASWRDRVAAAACLVLPSLALVAYARFLHDTSTPSVYNIREAQILEAAVNPRRLLSLVMHSAAGSYLYIGLFMMPAIPLLARGARRFWPAIAAATGLAASAGYVVKYGVRMPLFGNVLHDIGLSPVLIPRADLWPHAPASMWIVATIAAGLAASLIVHQTAARIHAVWQGPRRAPAVLAAVGCAAYLAPLLAAGFMFDRYLTTPLILVIAFLAAIGAFPAPSRAAAFSSLLLVAALAAFDVAATRDLFSFNRARWAAVHDARERDGGGFVNGGFEVTGGLLGRVTDVPEWRQLIALGDVPGYTRVSSYEFPRLIGSHPGVLYVLQRDAGLR